MEDVQGKAAFAGIKLLFKRMKPIESTAEILVFRILGEPINKKWTDWAYDMVVAGFENENLVILAGEAEPYNQFELKSLTDKIFEELNLKYSDQEQVYRNYACYLIDQALKGKIQNIDVLDRLKDIYIDAGYEPPYRDFYSLHFAYDDLKYVENQWYWDGATRSNIDEIINDYLIKWRADCANRFGA